MADSFDVTQQPNPSGVGKPSSGTYGEGVALDNLKRQLPQPEPTAPAVVPSQAPPVPPPPQPFGGGGPPSALFKPTARPDVPVSTPLAQPPVNPVSAAQTSRQRNLAILQALIESPEVSDETREWAQTLTQTLIQGSRR